MFSCVGGFINLILHCRTTARADTATPPRLGFSFCVCGKALPDMQINAITGTNKDVWREEGRHEEGEGGRGQERRERKGQSHPWPISAALHAQHLLASQRSLRNLNLCLSFIFPSTLFFPQLCAFRCLYLCGPLLSHMLAELE